MSIVASVQLCVTVELYDVHPMMKYKVSSD